MHRKKAFTLTAMAVAMLSMGGTWALVHGQAPATSAGATSAPKTVAPGYGQFYFAGPGGGAYAAPADDDPEMTKLANDEAALAHQSQEIVSRYTESENEIEQKTIKAELREALAKQFDVQRERRELELKRIEERVRKLRDQIKKRNDARDTIIDRRLDQLINEAEGLGWGPNSGQAGRTNFFYGGFPTGQPQNPAPAKKR